jgi:hypothetical protein
MIKYLVVVHGFFGDIACMRNATEKASDNGGLIKISN